MRPDHKKHKLSQQLVDFANKVGAPESLLEDEEQDFFAAHEIGHWLSSSPERMNLSDFGLGPFGFGDDKSLVSPQRRLDEEAVASLIGFSILAYLELPYERRARRAGFVGHEIEEMIRSNPRIFSSRGRWR